MNREQLQDAYINEIIDGMDLKDCLALLHDLMDKDMDIYTDEELVKILCDAVCRNFPAN